LVLCFGRDGIHHIHCHPRAGTETGQGCGIGIRCRITFDAWGLVEQLRRLQFGPSWNKVVNLITQPTELNFSSPLPISAGWNLPWARSAHTGSTSGVSVNCTHFPTDNMGLVSVSRNRVAARFAGRIKYYEAWNEPGHRFFWGAQASPSPAQYLNYLRNVIRA